MKKVLRRPMASETGPARAIETGIRLTDTKKSSEATRPRRSGGTRRWRSVPQMTIGAENPAPSTKPAATTCHTDVARPKNTNGSAANPQPRFITVR